MEASSTEIHSASMAIVDGLAGHAMPTVIYGIPRGGMAAAYKLAGDLGRRLNWTLSVQRVPADPKDCWIDSLVVDDIVDTGRTIAPYQEAGVATVALYITGNTPPERVPTFFGRLVKSWVRFPWDEASGEPEDAVVRLMEWLGLDPTREALKETPRRVLSWLKDFRAGQDLGSELTTFDGEHYDEMVLVREVPFVALCEHHLLPFTGKAAVAYIPSSRELVPTERGMNLDPKVGGPILGLSKLARIVVWRARQATVQERLTEEIRAEVERATGSVHVAVVIEAEHSCMTLRGARAQGSMTITSALSGSFRTEPSARAEFLALATGGRK